MFGFLIKKNFCDGWDNLLSVVITNAFMLFVFLGLYFLFYLAAQFDGVVYEIAWRLVFVLSFIISSIFIFSYGDSAADIANFNGVRILAFFKAIPGVILDATLYGLIYSCVLLIGTFSINYYLFSTQSYFGLFLGAALAWILLFFILAMIWFIPIRSLMHNNFKKCFKKSFIILFDNTGFTILIAIYDLVLIVLSVLCIGFFPSVAGLLIANTNALRLRLYKYDYLEKHPELKTKKERRHIPWEELIFEDREILGPRKFKSFIFPWKSED